jgi:tetratricopeptide (TPR) repeat protein
MVTREKSPVFGLFRKFSQKKDLKRTVKRYHVLLKNNPKDFKSRLRLADTYLRMGILDDAIENYFRAGEDCIEQDLHHQAIAVFKRIVVLNPNMTEAYHKLGDLYRSQELYGEAKLQYDKILQLNPEDNDAQEALRQINRWIDKLAKDNKGFVRERVSEKDPVWESILRELSSQLSSQVEDDDHLYHFQLGVAFKEMGLFANAIEEFKLSGGDSALQYDLHLLMGVCYRELGHYERSTESFQHALNLPGLADRQYQELYYQMGVAFEECGQLTHALDAYTKASDYGDDVPATDFRSRIKRLKKQVQEA